MNTNAEKLFQKKGIEAAAGTGSNNLAMQLEDNRPQSVVQQKQVDALSYAKPLQRQANNTGLPDNLKSGVENLSGHAMDDVKVHYNSDKPAQLNAHAYAQGTDIHLASGQEKHLPHEAWHVVQQKQGRVKPTMQMKGKVNVNDDEGLEKEADEMGSKAYSNAAIADITPAPPVTSLKAYVLQRKAGDFARLNFFENQAAFYILYLGKVVEAKIVELKETGVVLEIKNVEEQHESEEKVEVSKESVESDAFEIRSDHKDLDGEKRFNEAKGASLEDVFKHLVELGTTKKRDDVTEHELGILRRANMADGTAAELTAAQLEYQHLLLTELGIPKGMIMDFNRSLGFEFEFAAFRLINKDIVDKDDVDNEILRSHILLAASGSKSPIFDLPFSLETDSNNALEIVTPPLLLLVSADTAGSLAKMHNLYSAAALILRHAISQPDNELLAGKLDAFEPAGFGGEWQWKGPDADKLSATEQERATKSNTIYGQVNLSLSATEIIRLINLQADEATLPLNPKDSDSTQLFKNIFATFNKDKDLKSLRGALAFYAKTVSNILGIPSVLFRQQQHRRPEPNQATGIKETLGLWVKDFHHLVFSDYFKAHSDIIGPFIENVKGKSGEVGEITFHAIRNQMVRFRGTEIKNFLKENSREVLLQKEKSRLCDEARNSNEALRDKPDSELLQVIREPLVIFMGKLNGLITERTKTFDIQLDENIKFFETIALQEYERMNALLIATLTGKKIAPERVARTEDEPLGSGQGVRKETYLGGLPGQRGLRVAEIRNTDDITKIQDSLNAQI